MRNTDDAIARALDAALTLCIKPHPLVMIAAIDLNDALDGVRTKFNDVFANDDLAAKADAESAALEVTPEHCFRVGWIVAHEASALLECELA